ELLNQYGNQHFSMLDIWTSQGMKDPRSRFEKLLHCYLRFTQPAYVRWRPYQKASSRKSPAWYALRMLDETLKLFFLIVGE
ncbi:MAG TPA: hypothetical protein VEF04_05940, partial [Blastocatellia bacterium]|nr:hypothetical protein [Blastocatellia bacterium]